MTYCDRITDTAPEIEPTEALLALRPWQQCVKASDRPLSQAADACRLTASQEDCLHALYAHHVRQIDQIVRRLYDREVQTNGRSVLTIADLQAEGYSLFRMAVAGYDPTRGCLSTYVHTVVRTRLMDVLDRARKRDHPLDDASAEGEIEPAASTYTAELPIDLDLAEIAHAVIDDQPEEEHARLRSVWLRLRDPRM